VSTQTEFAHQAVENLVSQFSSALDFYRELVQNSIDAGSSEIEIWLDFIPAEDGGSEGVIEIHVDDFGEGMNGEIIDDQLTTLFSSSKEDDLTKIGKFGIGFVSVFALHPRAVLVQTGRGGECWEVLFDHDRSFFKSRLDTLVEGTQITLFLEGDRARYTALIADSRETLDRWCRHSEAEIGFEDRASVDGQREVINRPFSVAGECLTRVEHEGTRIVLAYSAAQVWGFYNRGLTLAVGAGKTDLVSERLERISFRLESRYIEHTLSRETVMRDENYDKAMTLLHEAADGPLRRKLTEALVALVAVVAGSDAGREGSGEGGTSGGPKRARRRWTAAERGRYFTLMGCLAHEGPEVFADLPELLELPLLVTVTGEVLSMATLRKLAASDGRVFVDDQTSELAEGLERQGTPVILVADVGGSMEAGSGSGSGGTGGPACRVIVNGLMGSLATTRWLEQVVDTFRGRMADDAWTRAAQLLGRPSEALVEVRVIADQEAAEALIASAQALILEGLGKARGPLRRALDRARLLPPRVGYSRLVGARLGRLPGGVQPLFVVAHAIAPMMALPTPAGLESALDGHPEAAVNIDHPHFRSLLSFAEAQPSLAAYCLAKSLLLHADRGLDLDPALMHSALAGRA